MWPEPTMLVHLRVCHTLVLLLARLTNRILLAASVLGARPAPHAPIDGARETDPPAKDEGNVPNQRAAQDQLSPYIRQRHPS